jgi:hypothetical protein
MRRGYPTWSGPEAGNRSGGVLEGAATNETGTPKWRYWRRQSLTEAIDKGIAAPARLRCEMVGQFTCAGHE